MFHQNAITSISKHVSFHSFSKEIMGRYFNCNSECWNISLFHSLPDQEVEKMFKYLTHFVNLPSHVGYLILLICKHLFVQKDIF